MSRTRAIDDAGEVIEGARKDWSKRALSSEDFASMSAEEAITEVKKDHVWPKPDWKALVDAGMEPLAAAHIRIIRERLAQEPKPRRGIDPIRQRGCYVEIMSALKERFEACKTVDDVKTASQAMRDTYQAIYPYDDDVSISYLSVFKSRIIPFAVQGDDFRKAEALVDEGFPNPVPSWRRGVSVKEDPRGRFYLRKGGSILASDFPSKEEALSWLEKQNSGPRKSRTSKDAKETPARPHLEGVERSGLPDHRNGRDVEPEEFIETFGFRGVQFGLWLPDEERQTVLNMAYDACRDLADILGWEPDQLSLDGTLAISFGARGKGGGHLAHYEPGQKVINMTRLSGAGALAHEFAHAFDHWLGSGGVIGNDVPSASGWNTQQSSLNIEKQLAHRGAQVATACSQLMSQIHYAPLSKQDFIKQMEEKIEKGEETIAKNAENIKAHTSRPEGRQDRSYLRRAYRWQKDNEAVMARMRHRLEEARQKPEDTNFGTDTSSFYRNACALSGSGDYWKRPCELFARSFESWVFDQLHENGGTSDYLVHGVEAGRYSDSKYKGDPYPNETERKRLAPLFSQIAELAGPMIERTAQPAPAA